MTAPVPPSLVSCADLVAALPAYRDGTLDAGHAWALEMHAAHCAACAEQLDTGVIDVRELPGPDADTRAALRHTLLSHVRTHARMHTRTHTNTPADVLPPTTSSPRPAWRRAAPWATLAATAALAVMLRPASPPGGLAPASAASADSMPADIVVAFDATTSAPMRSALRLAESQAATEFAALDAAERELERSLAAAPGDPELQRFHDTLEARRRELSQRVSSVTE